MIGAERESLTSDALHEKILDEGVTKNAKDITRFNGLMQKSFMVDFKNRFPSIIVFAIVCLVMGGLIAWFASLLDMVL